MTVQTSLRRRFFVNSALTLLVVMCISLIVADYSYRSELEKSADQRLRLHIFNLLSVTEKTKQSIELPPILRNPRFNTLNSGLWALVLDDSGDSLWQSLSLQQLPELTLETQDVGSWLRGKHRYQGQNYLTMSYKIAWETNSGQEHYLFIVAEDQQIIDQDVGRFRWWLGICFATLTCALLLGQHLVLRSSFRPILELEKEISDLEKGEQQKVEKTYPIELHGVTENLNALIHKEYAQREKYRASMADLAHSLKTPLAIVKGELQSAVNQNDVLQKAMVRIDQTIEYQLRRAVISGHSLLEQGTAVSDVLDDLIEVLNHAHRDSQVDVLIEIAPGLQFYGDDNDLMEVLGNLLDNAFRYARQQIRVTAKQSRQQLTLVIEDDGIGFTDEEAAQIFKRGERLDRQDFGQGIGLAVVYDIINSYQGCITAGRSPLGGACFTLVFPSKLQLESI
ncbi:ATP-binding protein [Oceanospirillum beijerinckii]|uniref:ATP-binding protein n=1 Tax=Oceanospirillum beijerinckii TaxID=64976 RepID=UPI00048A2B07|nr:ATP-binding protein [Oceanospirillum beijerinckii]